MSLFELALGKRAVVDRIYGNEKLAKRLLALGCIEGTEISVKGYAPLGDPIIINFRGFNMAIRKKDAANILVREA